MNKENKHKSPSSTEAYISIVVVFGSVVACLAFGIAVQGALLLAAVIAFLFAMHLGFSWKEIEKAISDRMGQITPTLITLLLIGFFLGTVLFSGTLPLLVSYGFKLISPNHLYLSALLVCSVLSVSTGSSWTAASTCGVVCMLICRVLGANEAIMAGAVISGSIFGDKISPMSETTNLAPACTGNTLWSHIHAQLYTTIPAYILSMIFFAVLDLSNSGGVVPEYAAEIIDQLGDLFNLSPILLLPVVILLVLSLMRKPVIPSFIISGFSAIILGVLLQGDQFTISLGASAAISGFSADMIAPEGMDIFYEVEYLLDRGGMISMASVVIMCYCGFSMTTIMTVTGLMKKAVDPLMKFANTRVRAVVTAEVADFAILAMSGASYMSSAFVGQAWRRAYIKNGCGLPALSRTLEDIGTTMACLIPWTGSSAVFFSALGVSAYGVGGYWKYATLAWMCPIIAVILAITGIGMFKLTPEQQAEELARLDAEEE